MPFCPQCGFDLADLPRQDAKASEPGAVLSTSSAGPIPSALQTTPAREGEVLAPAKPEVVRPTLRPADRVIQRGRGIPPIVIAGFLVMVGLLGYGLLTRSSQPPVGVVPQASGGGIVGSTAAPALISGLTILSPADGQAVATKDVNVIGTAPPGVTVTQDISFGLDQHTTSDGTGHWTMKVGLKDGDNKLVFRIGDDSSTRREIRVVYTPQAP
jgi:hypothetical protein